jgi:hypothetical protein
MERERIPKEWINRKVIVVVKNESRGTYAVLGRLREVTDEEFRLVMRSSGRLRTFSATSGRRRLPISRRGWRGTYRRSEKP